MHKMNIADRGRDAAWAMKQFEQAEFSTVAANGDGGTPYNVPMIVFRVEDALYFHTAMQGHLNDLLAKDGRVCVTCVPHTARDPENTTMRYRSAMAFGVAQPVEDKAEKMRIMTHFFNKYLPNNPKHDYYVDRVATVAMLYKVTISDITGKESLPGHNV